MKRFLPGCFRGVTLVFLLGAAAVAAPAPVADERAVENLAAFARVFGYVRYFHPSDEAAAIDWDKFAILAAERVRDARDPAVLRAVLTEIFQPIAPALRLRGEQGAASVQADEKSAGSGQLIYWQHVGVQLAPDSRTYRSLRVAPEKSPLFKSEITRKVFSKNVAPGLVIELPLALPTIGAGRTSGTESAEFVELKARLAALDLKTLTPGDARLRIAGVLTAWNVFQHFHPYLDSSGIAWEETLRPALRRALTDRTAEDYYATLSELVAGLRDGHGYVFGRPDKPGGLPIKVAVIEGKVVVTAVEGETSFRRGDVIIRIDGAAAFDVLRERERYVSGSPHLRRFRALNQFGEGPLDSAAKVELERDGLGQTLSVARTRDRRGFFFNTIVEFDSPAFAEVRPGIFYVNLQGMTASDLAEKWPVLASARGVIFDQRLLKPSASRDPKEAIQPHLHVIPHLIDTAVQASPMRIPKVTLPDRQGWEWTESTWPVAPQAPRVKGRVVFINVPPVVSYGETCMAMIAHYKLAQLVGEPTAGCNGNTNFLPLPGGFRVMWTGMEVLKHDRSHFYGTGFVPDFPVERTLQAVKEGRDEFLEKAIAVIERG